MKNFLSLLIALVVSLGAFAQGINIQNASESLQDNDFVKALQYLDKAAVHPKTATNFKVHMMKGVINQAIATQATKEMPIWNISVNGKTYALNLKQANELSNITPNAIPEAIKAYKKTIAVGGKKVDDREITPLMANLLSTSWNNAAQASNEQNFQGAYEGFDQVLEIYNAGKKFFSGNPQIAQYESLAKVSKGLAAYYVGKDDIAVPLLEEAIEDPKTQDVNYYRTLAEIYKKKNQNEKFTAILKKAKAKFPEDKGIANMELNAAITGGNADVAINKLKDAIAKDPERAELHFNLGIFNSELYKKETDPVKKESYYKAAKNAYEAAAKRDANNPDYIYSVAALDLEKASAIQKLANSASDAEYPKLQKQLDVMYAGLTTVLEKTRMTYEKSANFKSEESQTSYKQVLQALKTIYVNTNKMDKVKQIGALLGE